MLLHEIKKIVAKKLCVDFHGSCSIGIKCRFIKKGYIESGSVRIFISSLFIIVEYNIDVTLK